MTLVLDIETVPTAASMALPYPEAERQPPGNMSKPETIARWREADRVEWETARIKQYSLDPRRGRVVCLGWMGVMTDAEAWVDGDESGESALLSKFWKLADAANGRVVTWNGSWDLRFLVVRSLIQGVEPSLPAGVIRGWFRKYAVEPHCDVKALLTNWNPTDGHMDDWCACLGITGKTGSGADVYGMHQRGEFDAIAAYCKQDVRATHDLYLRVARMFVEAA